MITPELDTRTYSIAPKVVTLDSDLEIGADKVVLMTGPCSVESYEQTRACAAAIHKIGGRVLRGGAYKPRTSPYSFQGLGLEALKILRSVADEFGLLVVTEALGVEHIPAVERYADIIQIGARNMQHFPLLWAAGETTKPVLLKRGFMSTIEEWLFAAEHILGRGNEQIILCERGIPTFDTLNRHVLDTNAIALAKSIGQFPVIGDPSHATGRADLVLPAARAAVASGADGLLVEFHPHPDRALSDPEQALPLNFLPEFKEAIHKIAVATGRELT